MIITNLPPPLTNFQMRILIVKYLFSKNIFPSESLQDPLHAVHAATQVPQGRAGGSRNKRELKQPWSCQFLVKWSRGRNTPASLGHPSPGSAARPPRITETDSEQRRREPKPRQRRAGLGGPSRTWGQQGQHHLSSDEPCTLQPPRWQSDPRGDNQTLEVTIRL